MIGLAALAAIGCYPGAYPSDPFREMHYQQSQRLLEPERRLPPPDSVPITGAKPPLTFADAGSVTNSLSRTAQMQVLGRTRTVEQAGQDLFEANCAACHGADGRGSSEVAKRFASAGFVTPADLSSSRVRGRKDGELYWFINYGIGNMPTFRDLLTDDQIWALVYHIRRIQGQ
jgi:mono/diheme cytochrome c family protein